jgi:hypothetical protein
VALSLAVVGGTSACSDKTDGSAVPGNTTTTEQRPTTGPSTSDQPTNNDSLKDKDPCSVLTSAGQSQLGISNGEKRQLGEARSCRWRQRGSTETFLFDVSIYDNSGIKDLPSDREIKQLSKIGKHEAVQRTETANPGVCAVIMGVTESSRVSTQVTAGTDTQKGCQLAMQLAQLVEPELP